MYPPGANEARRAYAAQQMIPTLIEVLALHGDSRRIRPELRAVARLRIEHPDASLEQIGQMMSPPITKHAVAGRLARLSKMGRPARR